MRTDLPLKAVAYFDAVMRYGSLVTAAQTLCVTPGAVGQQIRRLEEWLESPLFIRSVRQLRPTREAHALWNNVRPALDQLNESCVQLRDGIGQEVRLSLPPALASKWFARRMPALLKALPQVRLNVGATEGLLNFDTDEVDLAIRHCDGKVPGLNAQLLLADDLRVYCSPRYCEQLQLVAIQDIGRARLLHTASHNHWSRWLGGAGYTGPVPHSSMQFDQSLLSIDAARRGQGLVLTSPWLVEDELEAGLLVQLFSHTLSVNRGFYLLHRNDSMLPPSTVAVQRWLLQAAGLQPA
ncbi:LysR substrate-binding domain-containing protein [Pseudomonas sp. NPDC012596]|uniref:LysR substrate-binding domain-containing protein n=1 Tax=Pseudomonas sp. NPDC012596 TaxID=3364419 RepID=UPI0036BC0A31